MAAERRLSVSLRNGYALEATRQSVGRNKLVYAIVADKKLEYPKGRSRVAYIGTTRKGVRRVAASVAGKADKILDLRGVRSCRAYIITCRARQRVRTWLKLERALLIVFREIYGDTPRCNRHGKKMQATDQFDYFARPRLRSVLEELA
jgi:hypothetical protein